jgi:protein involved in polysaccharide export with SLBB domain
VSVIGSVNNQGNVAFIPGAKYKEYISKAGGYTSGADKSQVRVINSKSSSYVDPSSDSDYELGPGDTIVIPAEQHTFWEDFGKATAITAQIITIFAGIFLLSQKASSP